VSDEELGEVLLGIIGKPLVSAAAAPDFGVLMLTFPEGETLYVRGDNLSIDMEAAS
jgi:hypothetical protein